MIDRVAEITPAKSLHHRVNNGLSLALILLALYIMIWPFLPAVNLWWRKHLESGNGYVYHSKIAPATTKATKPAPIPSDNRLVIPGLRMNEAINEGSNSYTLAKGVWRWPTGDSPDRGGNTVLIGHRFTYAGAAVFYNLDKVNAGDPIIVYWGGKEYDYRVNLIEIVTPNDVKILDHSTGPMLTIYTCTPLWTAQFRLIIMATPI